MSAYYRRRGEDRVTEVFAAVLVQSPELLGRLVDRVGLASAGAYQVQTQVHTGRVTIDLEVQGLGHDGNPQWFLWSEHKVTDPLTAFQLENERRALASRAGAAEAHLMAITLLAPTSAAIAFAVSTGCTLLRWGDVTELARAALNRPAAERLTGLEPTVADHLAREWIAFAENELEAPVDALTPDRVRLLPDIEKALDTIAHISATGFKNACAEIAAGTPKEAYDAEIHATAPKDSWLSQRGFKLYVKYLPEGGFGSAEAPCFVVGGWIEGAAAVSERRSHELHTVLGSRGLAIWDEEDRRGGWIEFGRGIALVELTVDETLQAQVAAFSAFCLSTLRSLAEDPG